MILITGGAGFIGSNIAASLAAAGREISVCDAFGTTDKWRNLAKTDVADLVAPQELFPWLERHADRVEAIIHLGAVSSTTEPDVDLILRNNFSLSRDLWAFCAQRGVAFFYASSAATYGDGSAGFDDDASVAGLARLRPLNPYGWSKLLFDRFVAGELARGRLAPPQWVGLKFFNVYGPNEHHKGAMKSVVAQIYPRAAAGETVALFRSHHPDFADGGQMRDFIYVRDCVDVLQWFMETPSVSGLFNLGIGRARSFLDLAKAAFAALGREPKIAYVDTPADIRDRYQYFTQANMQRLRAAGYQRPFTSLEDGVSHYVREYLNANDPYR